MLKIEYAGKITDEKDLSMIWDLLCASNDDFVPRLSSRNGSLQKDFSVDENQDKPYKYFEVIKEQHFVVAREEDGRIVAFLTFRPEYSCKDLEAYGTNVYMTTFCMYKEYRGTHLSSPIYDVVEHGLPESMRTPYIMTRTWSSNDAQQYIFPHRGYQVVKTLKDDRGPGIDTVYYVLDVKEYLPK